MKNVVKYAWQRIVGCFLAGALAVLPLVITVAVVVWVADFIAGFIGPETVIGTQLGNLGLQVATDSSQVIAYLIGWVVVLGVVLGLGVVIELGAKKIIGQLVDGVLTRVPLLGSVYSTSKQVVQMLDKKDEDALKGMKAVFCFFGSEGGAGMLALLVSPNRFHINERDYQAVIVPTAPVPFGGGLLFVPVESIHPANMSVDGLMSIYVSMGVTAPEYLASGTNEV